MTLRPWTVAAHGFAFGGVGAGLGGELALQIGWRDEGWGVALGPVASLAGTHTPANGVQEKSLGGELSIDRFVPLGEAWTLRLGVDARGEWAWQRVERNDAARVAAAGLPASASYGGAMWGGGAHVALRFFVTPGAFVEVGVRGLALGAKTTDGAEGRLVGGGTIGVGAAF
jgi:hypothetical protein